MKGRSLLMIPGPVESEPEVLAALADSATSHVAPAFIELFGRALERLRVVFGCPDGQPFIVAGSGTLAMDLLAANLTEPGTRALVVNTGYFGDRFGDMLTRYGAEVTHLRAPIGSAPTPAEVDVALSQWRYDLLTITHVDTSTGVRADVQSIAAVARRHDVLCLVDGVCSVGGEALDMAGWGVDAALTASQKALAVPPGLALAVAGRRALAAFRARKMPVASYYSDWNLWLPIMQAYEARRPAYFATPAVNLVHALEVSLAQILAEGMEARIARHRRLSDALKAGIAALGLKQVPLHPELAATTLTAVYYPDGVDASLLPKVAAAGVILAGGLHKEIRDRYFRIGHMGAVRPADILATLGALETGLAAAGYRFDHGAGVAAAQASLTV
jgi:alanine-glyoxylate transaminase/serine-glyoxylate transaminase/serine-pyruvate transaminase